MSVIQRKQRRVFKDKRGDIDNLLEGVPILHISRISCVKGSVRCNHYHQHDEHYCFVESGELIYTFENKDGSERGDIRLKVGDLIHTPTLEKHRFTALEDSVFYSFTIQKRDNETYENDTVRVEF